MARALCTAWAAVSNRASTVAATRSLPEDPYGQDAGIVGKIIDFFKKIADPAAAAKP